MKKLVFFLLPFMASCASQQIPLELNVMTYNIRYDNPEDGQNNWKFRKDNAATAIKFYDVDILGTQEVLHNQLIDLKQRLTDYDVVGVGRQDGKEKGEYSALWYKKNRFTVLESGYFWLSETPNIIGSKGWDGACERIASWVRLKEKETNKIVFALNTHFDHVGVIARKESVKLILNEVEKLSKGCAVIVTGDFNAEPTSNVVKDITDNKNKMHLTDSRQLSPIVYGPAWSFHDFGRIPIGKRSIIDYVFLKNNVRILKYGVLAEQDGEIFLSDHAPVLVRISIK